MIDMPRNRTSLGGTLFGEVQDSKGRFARFAVPITPPPDPYTFGQEGAR